jgi:hypothetical protein
MLATAVEIHPDAAASHGTSEVILVTSAGPDLRDSRQADSILSVADYHPDSSRDLPAHNVMC